MKIDTLKAVLLTSSVLTNLLSNSLATEKHTSSIHVSDHLSPVSLKTRHHPSGNDLSIQEVLQENNSNFFWVPGTMTVQRDQIVWIPDPSATSASKKAARTSHQVSRQSIYAPRSFCQVSEVRFENKTQFVLLARAQTSSLSETLLLESSLKMDAPDINSQNCRYSLEFNKILNGLANWPGDFTGPVQYAMPQEGQQSSQLGERFRVSGSVQPWVEAIQGFISQVSGWEKLYQLGSDFVMKATTFGRMIIEEYDLPNNLKAIKKVSVGGVAGGDKFIIHDILFKFCVDPQPEPGFWIYGMDKADHTKAFKSFGQELLGANAVSSYGTWLKTPLMAIIDFRGRRLMASSLIPKNDNTLVYGSSDGGKTVKASDKTVNQKMAQIGKDFNLQPHNLKGVSMALCGDIEVHRCPILGQSEPDYYALDLARVFPPQNATAKTKKQNVFYQKLNPRFVKAYKTPLNSDSFSKFHEPTNKDNNTDELNLQSATYDTLFGEVVPRFAQELLALPIPEALSVQASRFQASQSKQGDFLISRLHEAGLNIRHLGLVWNIVEETYNESLTQAMNDPDKIKATSDYILNVMITRVLKNHVRTIFREKIGHETGYQYFITDVLNHLAHPVLDEQVFWTTKIPPLLKDQFNITLSDFTDQVHQGYLLTTFCRLMGVVIWNHPVYQKNMSFNFAPSDIANFQPVIKYLNIVDLATGMYHRLRGLALMLQNPQASSGISRIGLDHLIQARDKLTTCRLTWNNPNHPVLPGNLDGLISTLETLIQANDSHVGLDASLRDNGLYKMVSQDGYIDTKDLREFWTSGSTQFPYVKVQGELPDDVLYRIMVLPTNIQRVDVSQCRGLSKTATKILSLLFDHNITSLDLYKNNIGDAGVKALMRNANLTDLNLNENNIGDAGAQALAYNTTITSLKLHNNNISDVGAQALAHNTTLASLALGGNKITDIGAQALMGNTTLTILDLSYNYIRNINAEALANNASLTVLNLNYNTINNVGAQALAHNATLTKLYLIDNNIGDVGAQEFAHNTSLVSLNLRDNKVSDKGAQGLAQNTKLTSLNLHGNNISDIGAKSLAQNTSLTLLNLNSNNIGDKGAKSLARNLVLTSLGWNDNKIGKVGEKALSKNSNLQRLNS